jgi:hypothetical protein
MHRGDVFRTPSHCKGDDRVQLSITVGEQIIALCHPNQCFHWVISQAIARFVKSYLLKMNLELEPIIDPRPTIYRLYVLYN